MIRIATKAANASKFRRARVGAVIAKGNRILSVGHNRIGFSKYLPDRPYPESVHAEQQAILQLLKARKLNDLAGSTIFVSRIDRSGTHRLARPCRVCNGLIRAVHIHRVVYTTDNGVEEYVPYP